MHVQKFHKIIAEYDCRGMRKTVVGSTDRQFGNLDSNHHQTVMITVVATS